MAYSIDFQPVLKPDEKYFILPINRLGFGNRMRIMSSFFTISERMNRHLIVLWSNHVECNIRFDQIFRHNLERFRVIDVDDDESQFEFNIKISIRNFTAHSSLTSKYIDFRNFFFDKKIMLDDDIIIAWTRGFPHFIFRDRLKDSINHNQACTQSKDCRAMSTSSPSPVSIGH